MFTARGTSVYINGQHFASCDSVAQAQTFSAWARIGYERGLGDGIARAATFAQDIATLAKQFTNISPGRDAQRVADVPTRSRPGDDTPADRGDPAGSTPSEPGVAIGGDLHSVEGGNVVSLIGITDKGVVRIIDAKAC